MLSASREGELSSELEISLTWTTLSAAEVGRVGGVARRGGEGAGWKSLSGAGTEPGAEEGGGARDWPAESAEFGKRDIMEMDGLAAGTVGAGVGELEAGGSSGVVLVTRAITPRAPGCRAGRLRPALRAASSRFLDLRTWARGGPGGSSITVTMLVLSALSLLEFHRSMAQSTSCLLGLIQDVFPSTGLSMCCSLALSAMQTVEMAFWGVSMFQAPSVPSTRQRWWEMSTG